MGAIPALAHDNAGLNFQYMPWTCLLLLLAVPALLSEFPRWSRLVQVPMIIMVVLLPISFIFAPIKSDFPATILTFTGMFLVAAAASQLWHYSKKLLLALLSITAIAYFVQGIFTWMVVLAPGQERLWRSLGWHNPSAAFFGALALIPLAAALATSSTKLRVKACLPAPVSLPCFCYD